MKTITRLFTDTATVLLIVAVSVIALRCSSEKSMDSLEILRRIPADNALLVTFKPAEMLRSNLFQSLSLKGKEMKNIHKAGREFRAKTGINPIDDVERVVIMSGNLRNIESSWCILIQGNMKGFYTDSIRAEKDIEFNTESTTEWNVEHLIIRKKGEPMHVYLYHDDGEIMFAAREDIMKRMLDIKRNGGKTLDEDVSFIRRFRNLAYTKHAWGTISVGDLMDDVIKKVHEKKPDLKINKLEISNIQSGIYLNGKLGVSANVFCPNREQTTLLHDALNGLLAFGKLTFGSTPEMRKILDNVEVTQTEDQLNVNASISLQEILALENLKHNM